MYFVKPEYQKTRNMVVLKVLPTRLARLLQASNDYIIKSKGGRLRVVAFS